MRRHDGNREIDRAKIARIKQEIAAGRYETPEKLAAAVDAFLEEHWQQAANHQPRPRKP